MEAIKTISKGGTPSGHQVARPELMNIIRFFMTIFDCTKKKEISEEYGSEEKPNSCAQCDVKFPSEEEMDKHECRTPKSTKCSFCDEMFTNEEIVDQPCLFSQAKSPVKCNPASSVDHEKPFSCSQCDKSFQCEKELK